MTTQAYQLALECRRQSESCLYSSTCLYIWLRVLRIIRVAYLVITLSFGTFAGWHLLKNNSSESVQFIAGLMALVAGLLPTIYSALKLDEHLMSCADLAAEFKNLQDRFRQAALITSQKSFVQFDLEARELLRRLEEARKQSVTPPEWCFRLAQAKVAAGHYSFEVDTPDLDPISEADTPVK
jgi:hypothetical protein